MSEKNLHSWQEFRNDLVVRAMKDGSFRKELLADPKTVAEKEMGKLKEGFKLPAALEVKVIEQPANALYLVLPTMPERKPSCELSDEALAKVAGGWGNREYSNNDCPSYGSDGLCSLTGRKCIGANQCMEFLYF